jgi:hypothetical protein
VHTDERDLHLAHEQVDVVAGIANRGDSLVVAGDVVAAGSEQQPDRIVALEQVRRADGAGAVHALELRPRGADVANRLGVVAVADRRAVRGDVVGDELAEERPRGRHGRVRPVVAGVAGSAGAAERVQRGLVDLERGQLSEQLAVTASVYLRARPFGHQAMIASDCVDGAHGPQLCAPRDLGTDRHGANGRPTQDTASTASLRSVHSPRMSASRPNVRLQRRVETVIRVLEPPLNLLLAVGERLSRVLTPTDPEYVTARMPLEGESAPRGLRGR